MYPYAKTVLYIQWLSSVTPHIQGSLKQSLHEVEIIENVLHFLYHLCSYVSYYTIYTLIY